MNANEKIMWLRAKRKAEKEKRDLSARASNTNVHRKKPKTKRWLGKQGE